MLDSDAHLSLAGLQAFFVDQQENKEWPQLQEFECSQDQTEIMLGLYIPADLSFFKGHFPDQAVLPGVVQINWAGMLAEKLFTLSSFSTLQTNKFNNMILPNTTLKLTLIHKPEKNSVSFEYFNETHRFSSGRIIFSGDSK